MTLLENPAATPAMALLERLTRVPKFADEGAAGVGAVFEGVPDALLAPCSTSAM